MNIITMHAMVDRKDLSDDLYKRWDDLIRAYWIGRKVDDPEFEKYLDCRIKISQWGPFVTDENGIIINIQNLK